MNESRHLIRIVRLSRRLRWVVWFFFATVVLLTVAVLILPSASGLIRVGVGADEVALSEAGAADRWSVVGLMAPTLIVWLGVLWQCDRLLALYEAGQVFRRASAVAFGRIGRLVVALACLQVGLPLLVALLVPSYEPRLSTASLGVLGIGLGIVTIGHVMSLAAEMAEESELTI